MTTSTAKLSPGAMRACVILALCIAPSAPTSADPRIVTAPRSTAMLLSEAPSAIGLTRKVALPGFPAGFETPGTGLSTPACVRSISTSALARVSGALSLIGSGPGQPRAEVEAALGARGGVEREGHGRRAFLSWRSADLDVGRGAQEVAVARDLQIIAIGVERGRRGIEFFVGEELVDLEVGERPGSVELRVLGTRGLAELEVEGEIAFRLPLDGRGIDRKTRLAAQRLAR